MNVDSTYGPAEPLSLGSIVEPSADNGPWRESIQALALRIADARADVRTVLNVNVVFHVPGRQLKPEFNGIRTASYSVANRLLMVQVALPEHIPADPDAYVRSTVKDAIDAAERWATNRNIDVDALALHAILDQS